MKRKILKYILKFLAKIILWRYRPEIIGVTGTAGKSSSKEAIYSVISNNFLTAKSVLNLNTDVGLPLTIIRGVDAKRNILLWIKNFLKALLLIIIKDKNYPKILVLEMSEDKPKMIQYLTDLAQPKIGVLTWIGETPVHVTNFKDTAELIEELEYLIKSLPENGQAVLNIDCPLILKLRDKIKINHITYGFHELADLQITNYKIIFKNDRDRDTKSFQDIASFCHLNYKGSYLPISIKGVFGKPQIYALSAAASVGLCLGLNLVEIVKQLEKYQLLPGRTSFIQGINNSWILDDSYNANPDSVKAALETFQDIYLAINQDDQSKKRKIVILGEMRELGKYSDSAHKEIGELVLETADIFIGIGEKMKLAVEVAENKKNNLQQVYYFSDSWQAAKEIKSLIEDEDLILIKGSRGIHTEQITKTLMLNPQEAEQKLIFEMPT